MRPEGHRTSEQPQEQRGVDDQASKSSAALSQEALRRQRQLYFEVGCLSRRACELLRGGLQTSPPLIISAGRVHSIDDGQCHLLPELQEQPSGGL